jgi:hypothetical protein
MKLKKRRNSENSTFVTTTGNCVVVCKHSPIIPVSTGRYIHSTNRRDLTFKLSVNHLADLSDTERKQMRGYRHTKNSPRGETFVIKENAPVVPKYFNWRLRGSLGVG